MTVAERIEAEGALWVLSGGRCCPVSHLPTWVCLALGCLTLTMRAVTRGQFYAFEKYRPAWWLDGDHWNLPVIECHHQDESEFIPSHDLFD